MQVRDHAHSPLPHCPLPLHPNPQPKGKAPTTGAPDHCSPFWPLTAEPEVRHCQSTACLQFGPVGATHPDVRYAGVPRHLIINPAFLLIGPSCGSDTWDLAQIVTNQSPGTFALRLGLCCVTLNTTSTPHPRAGCHVRAHGGSQQEERAEGGGQLRHQGCGPGLPCGAAPPTACQTRYAAPDPNWKGQPCNLRPSPERGGLYSTVHAIPSHPHPLLLQCDP